MFAYAPPLARLISELTKLPTIGPKTAQRLAFHILTMNQHDVEALAAAILEAKTRIRPCSVCGNITEADPCAICTDPRRDRSVICVVEQPRDVAAMERVREFSGLYHVLQGAISPLDGVGPEDLRIAELLQRVATGGVREVIIATNPRVEGEATASPWGEIWSTPTKSRWRAPSKGAATCSRAPGAHRDADVACPAEGRSAILCTVSLWSSSARRTGSSVLSACSSRS